MRVNTSEHHLNTTQKFEFFDITNIVRKSVSELRIQKGIVTIFTPHSTCSIKINELEKSLLKDFQTFFDMIAPQEREYHHNVTCLDGRPNTHSHLRSLLLNTSETIPITKGDLLLGQWQSIFFIELDGPREKRKYYIHILGE